MQLRRQDNRRRAGQAGYAMAALLVSVAVLSVLMGAALPVWQHQMQREKEAELVFRGEQYARAIGLFQRRFGAAFPPSIDVLVEQKFLRRKYRDPMTEDGEFQILYQASLQQVPGGPAARRPGAGQPAPGAEGPATAVQPQPPPGGLAGGMTPRPGGPQGGIVGVTSKSKEKSIMLYKGRDRYNEWQFVYAVAAQPGIGQQPGAAQPGQLPGRPGQVRPPGAPPTPVPLVQPPGSPLVPQPPGGPPRRQPQ